MNDYQNTSTTEIAELLKNFTDLGLVESSKQISILFNLKPEELETSKVLSIDSLKSYLAFAKHKYFWVEPGIGLSQEGELIADWTLANKHNVCITFLKNNKLEYVIKTKDLSCSNTTTTNKIVQILNDSGVSKK